MYLYGMRLRCFSIGCQPVNGFLRRMGDISGKYYDIIVYNRKLEDSELTGYELDYIGEDKENEDQTTKNHVGRF